MNNQRQYFNSSNLACFIKKNLQSIDQISKKVQNIDTQLASNLQVALDLVYAKVDSFSQSQSLVQFQNYLSDFYQQRITALTSQYNQLIARTNALQRQNRCLKQDITIKNKEVNDMAIKQSNASLLTNPDEFCRLQMNNYLKLIKKNQQLLNEQFHQIQGLKQALGESYNQKRCLQQKLLKKVVYLDAEANQMHQCVMWKIRLLDEQKQHSDQIIRKLDEKILQLHQRKHQCDNDMNFKQQELKVLTKRVYSLTNQLQARKQQIQRLNQLNLKMQAEVKKVKIETLCQKYNLQSTNQIWDYKIAEKLQIIHTLEKQVLCQQMIISQLKQKLQEAQNKSLFSIKQRDNNRFQLQQALRLLQEKSLLTVSMSQKLENIQRIKQKTIKEKENRQKMLQESQKQIQCLKTQLQQNKIKFTTMNQNLKKQQQQTMHSLNQQLNILRKQNKQMTEQNKTVKSQNQQIRQQNQGLSKKILILTEKMKQLYNFQVYSSKVERNYQYIKQRNQLIDQKLSQKQSYIQAINKVIEERNRKQTELQQQIITLKQEIMRQKNISDEKQNKFNGIKKQLRDGNNARIFQVQKQVQNRNKQIEKAQQKAKKAEMECCRLNFMIKQMQNKLKIANDQMVLNKKAYIQYQQTMNAKIKQLQRILKQKSCYFMSDDSQQSSMNDI